MRRLWAVARETFTECLRTRVVIVFVVLLGISVLTMALTMEGDGTLKGKMQTFLAYSTGATQLLLSLMTIFLAVSVVTGDIRHKYIFTVATKPLSRWQYVLGRWTGIVLLNGVLLALANGGIYGLAQYLRRTPTQIEQRKARELIAQNAPDPDRGAVETGIFTARRQHQPEPFAVEEEVKRQLDRLTEERRMEELIRNRVTRELETEQLKSDRDTPITERQIDQLTRDAATRERIKAEIRKELTEKFIEEKQLIRPGASMRLTFKGLKVPKGKPEPLLIRYRLRPMSVPESRLVKSGWEVYNPKTGLDLYMERDDSAETFSSFAFPPQVVTDEGELVVFYINLPKPGWHAGVKLKPEDVTVLYRVGSFEGNLARATILMLLRLMFLAALGILFGVFLSFPVACLVCLIVLGIGLMSGFIQDATRIGTYTGANPTAWDYFSHYLVQFIFLFLPTFSQSSPVESLIGGTIIPFRSILREFLAVVQVPQGGSSGIWQSLGFEAQTGAGLRTWICLALGWLIFRRRELAKVQV